jgi:hypothetical protein
MTAIEILLAGLFDYAGVYPPASLDMLTAAEKYREYRRSQRASALGRFIVSVDRIHEFRSIVGESLGKFALTVIVPEDVDWSAVARQIDSGIRIESIEVKCNEPSVIKRWMREPPQNVVTYFEVPIAENGLAALEAIKGAGARAKVRMGGVIPAAIPSIADVAQMLKNLAELRLPFKATAGLHHPMRAERSLTYHPQSPTGVMHGFMNLSAAAALLFFDGDQEGASQVLAEENPAAWQIHTQSISWRNHTWTLEQLATLRRDFFLGIGSCSFEEPIHDLESLGWL